MGLQTIPSIAIFPTWPHLLFVSHSFLQPNIHFTSCFTMSLIPLFPPLVNIYESKASRCYAVAITTYIIAVVAVALRFWARKVMKSAIWVDDWTAAVALTDKITTLTLELRPLPNADPPDRSSPLGSSLVPLSVRSPKNVSMGPSSCAKRDLQQGFTEDSGTTSKSWEWISQRLSATTSGPGNFLYCLTIGLVNFFILAFYWRLFRVSIRVPCYILGTVIICWEIAVVCSAIYPSHASLTSGS